MPEGPVCLHMPCLGMLCPSGAGPTLQPGIVALPPSAPALPSLCTAAAAKGEGAAHFAELVLSAAPWALARSRRGSWVALSLPARHCLHRKPQGSGWGCCRQHPLPTPFLKDREGSAGGGTGSRRHSLPCRPLQPLRVGGPCVRDAGDASVWIINIL